MEEKQEQSFQDEVKANRVGFYFLFIMVAITLVIWIANEIGIFIINHLYVRIGMSLSLLGILPAIIAYIITKGNNTWYKELLIISVSTTCIAVEIFLTYHAVLICITPVLLAVQYADWKLCKKAFVINHFGILVAVILGYFVGCWDGNMRYATTFGITMYNDSIGARIDTMTPFYMVELIGYFALPRMFIFSAFYFIIRYVVEAAKKKYIRECSLREKAEHDALTGLENRAKFDLRIATEYRELQSILIAFLDVNYLKKINDVCGHEAGDAVLKNTALNMNRIVSERVHGYRLGGDEFALVLCDYSEKEGTELVMNWYKGVGALNRKEDAVQCSLAVGIAYGENNLDIEGLMKVADEQMYENKRAMKAIRAD